MNILRRAGRYIELPGTGKAVLLKGHYEKYIGNASWRYYNPHRVYKD